MSKAPSAATESLGTKSKTKLPTDEEIEEQLAKLRGWTVPFTTCETEQSFIYSLYTYQILFEGKVCK